MIIIKASECLVDTVRIVACVLFNIECGRWVFSYSGELIDSHDEYLTISSEGMAYSICGNIGHIEILDGCNWTHTRDIIQRYLVVELHALDARCLKENVVLEKNNRQSVDFIASTDHTGAVGRIASRDIRIGQRTCDTDVYFEWIIHTKGCPKVLSPNPDDNVSEYANLCSLATVIIDYADIFEMSAPVSIIQKLENTEYRLFDRLCVAGMGTVNYIGKYNRFDSLLYSKCGISVHEQACMTGDIPRGGVSIYADVWANITPARCDKNIMITLDERLGIVYEKCHPHTQYDHKLSELNYERDIVHGAPISPNDECHGCYMYLYGDIYVMENMGIHVCMCAMCFHTDTWQAFDDMRHPGDVMVLRVQYPRTACDVIRDYIPSLVGEEAMIYEELVNGFTMDDGIVITENYIGCLDIKEFLTMEKTLPTGKRKVFAYQFHVER